MDPLTITTACLSLTAGIISFLNGLVKAQELVDRFSDAWQKTQILKSTVLNTQACLRRVKGLPPGATSDEENSMILSLEIIRFTMVRLDRILSKQDPATMKGRFRQFFKASDIDQLTQRLNGQWSQLERLTTSIER